MHRALLELTIEGVETSRDFHLRLMEDEDFRSGAIEIQWLERKLPELIAVRPPADALRAAVIAAALFADRDRKRGVPSATSSQKKPDASTDRADGGWKHIARLEGLR
jgi:acetyl-CoA carboxylase biotin carboxylase subunit